LIFFVTRAIDFLHVYGQEIAQYISTEQQRCVPNWKELDPKKINFVTKISVKFIPSQEIVTVHSPGQFLSDLFRLR